MAARRVAAQLGLPLRFVVGDARYLPFKNDSVETVFSYSVIQHFSYLDAERAIREASRVLAPKGTCLIQLPNTLGLRCLYHQAKRRFREPRGFEVRYWTPGRMKQIFSHSFRVQSFSADCFFGIGLQAADIKMMTVFRRIIIHASESAKILSKRLPILARFADSIWIRSVAR
jgi:SAM-dependent methyltransferase